jgi:hypothetical protein
MIIPTLLQLQYTQTKTSIYIYIHTYIYKCMHIYIHLHRYLCIHVHIIHTYAYMYTCIYTCIYIYIHIYTYINRQTLASLHSVYKYTHICIRQIHTHLYKHTIHTCSDLHGQLMHVVLLVRRNNDCYRPIFDLDPPQVDHPSLMNACVMYACVRVCMYVCALINI